MRTVSLVLLLACAACANGRWFFQRGPSPQEREADALYRSALHELDPSNPTGTLDSGLVKLDAYLASTVKRSHVTEAETLRRLARDAQELARVEAALDVARSTAATDTSAAATRAADAKAAAAQSRNRAEELVKEVQRLKSELAKANDELERIKKRLATPPAKP